jgi:hypothetical protein
MDVIRARHFPKLIHREEQRLQVLRVFLDTVVNEIAGRYEIAGPPPKFHTRENRAVTQNRNINRT